MIIQLSENKFTLKSLYQGQDEVFGTFWDIVPLSMLMIDGKNGFTKTPTSFDIKANQNEFTLNTENEFTIKLSENQFTIKDDTSGE